MKRIVTPEIARMVAVCELFMLDAPPQPHSMSDLRT